MTNAFVKFISIYWWQESRIPMNEDTVTLAGNEKILCGIMT